MLLLPCSRRWRVESMLPKREHATATNRECYYLWANRVLLYEVAPSVLFWIKKLVSVKVRSRFILRPMFAHALHLVGFRMLVATSAIVLSMSMAAHAYVLGERWTTTASGSAGVAGDPATITWSLARNGTMIPEEGGSNLISFLDGIFNVTSGGTNYTTRPWFSLFESSFNRWSQLSGLTFTYEPNDGSAALVFSLGVLGGRGDIRIGGQNIDGPGNILAYAYPPDVGDIVIDTTESSFYSASANNYLPLRNTLMHEIGHALGLDHVESSSADLLMEPIMSMEFDGPQLDDIRGIQSFYGDPIEKTNNGVGNNVAANAFHLGSLSVGGSLTIGSHAVGGQGVVPTETDFVSIANANDLDFYSFTLSAPALLDATLTPLGGIFMHGAEGGTQSLTNATAENNLALALYASDGTTLLGSADLAPIGQVESLSGLELLNPGQYIVRVSGTENAVQLYQLQILASELTPSMVGDHNADGAVDAGDYVLWRKHAGQPGSGGMDARDYLVWRANFGSVQGSGGGNGSHVPEPGGAAILALIFTGGVATGRVRRRPYSHG